MKYHPELSIFQTFWYYLPEQLNVMGLEKHFRKKQVPRGYVRCYYFIVTYCTIVYELPWPKWFSSDFHQILLRSHFLCDVLIYPHNCQIPTYFIRYRHSSADTDVHHEIPMYIIRYECASDPDMLHLILTFIVRYWRSLSDTDVHHQIPTFIIR